MSRLYFHLYDGVDTLIDPDGIDVPYEEASSRALAEARALIADEALRGRIDLRQRIDVEDAAGRLLHSLSFYQAVEIIAPH